MSFHDKAPALHGRTEDKGRLHRQLLDAFRLINDLQLQINQLRRVQDESRAMTEKWLEGIESCINKKTDAANEMFAAIADRFEMVEQRLDWAKESHDNLVPMVDRRLSILEGRREPQQGDVNDDAEEWPSQPTPKAWRP